MHQFKPSASSFCGVYVEFPAFAFKKSSPPTETFSFSFRKFNCKLTRIAYRSMPRNPSSQYPDAPWNGNIYQAISPGSFHLLQVNSPYMEHLGYIYILYIAIDGGFSACWVFTCSLEDRKSYFRCVWMFGGSSKKRKTGPQQPSK